MSTRYLLDPEILPLVDTEPPGGPFEPSDENLPQIRKMLAELPPPVVDSEFSDLEAAGVVREEVKVPCPGAADVRCLLYKPAESGSGRPGYLHVHGGGYLIGTPEMSEPANAMICAKLGAVVLSVDYRLAPEHKAPDAIADAYAGLAWLHESAEALGVDRKRIGVGGESAGGGLAASLALHARDEGKYAVCWQQLTYPMLDDRTGTPEQPGDPLVGEFIWTRANNQYGWNSYLGDLPRKAPLVPARAESLAGLPPAWISTASLDLFRDENIEYARRLMADGVVAELIVYPGACHGFQGIPGTTLFKRYLHDFLDALERGLAPR